MGCGLRPFKVPFRASNLYNTLFHRTSLNKYLCCTLLDHSWPWKHSFLHCALPETYFDLLYVVASLFLELCSSLFPFPPTSSGYQCHYLHGTRRPLTSVDTIHRAQCVSLKSSDTSIGYKYYIFINTSFTASPDVSRKIIFQSMCAYSLIDPAPWYI